MAHLPSSNNLPRPQMRAAGMSIRRKLTVLMLLIGLLPTLVVSAIGYLTTSNELRTKTTDQLVSTAVKQEQKITGLLQQRQEDVVTLTNRFDLQSALGQYLSSGRSADRDAINTILQDRKAREPDIQAVTVADLSGKVIATTLDDNQGKSLPLGDYAVSGDGTSVSVRQDDRDGINKLNIATKISVNKQSSGVVIVVFRMDDITAAIQDYTGLGTTGETVVAFKNSLGHTISLFPLRFDTDAALSKQLDSLHLFDAGSSTHTETDYRGHQVIVAPRPIGFANWVLATKIDTDEALASIVQLRNALITTVVLSSAAVLIVALWLTEFFTKPILYLAEIAQRIGKGDFGVRVNLRRNDEIGLLGDSINTMGMSLNDFVSHIQSQRNRLEVILNTTIESILAIDKHGTILTANAAAIGLTQLSREEIVGKNMNDIFGWTRDLQPFTVRYDNENSLTIPNLEFTDHTGATHFVRLIVARVSGDQAQEAIQTIVTVHDETKTRELENMKIDFVSMAAHELRTPLASLRGYIELISYKEGQHLSEETSKYLRQALKSSNELGGLINNLLDVTRIERGTLTLHMEHVDLAETVSQVVNDQRFAAEDKNITLSYDGPASGDDVSADGIALREVINNLLTNALKYTEPHGAVRVTLRRDGDFYITSVHDTGVGIPKKALPYLFTKFYRVHGGLDSGSTGTGLGLFISKSIVERHNGTISVTSEEGAGSVFTFTIPVADEHQLAELKQQDQSAQTFIRRHRGWITKNTTR